MAPCSAPAHIPLWTLCGPYSFSFFWFAGGRGAANIFSRIFFLRSSLLVEPFSFFPFSSYIYRLLYFFYSKIRSTSVSFRRKGKIQKSEINGDIIRVIMGQVFRKSGFPSGPEVRFLGGFNPKKSGSSRGFAGGLQVPKRGARGAPESFVVADWGRS